MKRHLIFIIPIVSLVAIWVNSHFRHIGYSLRAQPVFNLKLGSFPGTFVLELSVYTYPGEFIFRSNAVIQKYEWRNPDYSPMDSVRGSKLSMSTYTEPGAIHFDLYMPIWILFLAVALLYAVNLFLWSSRMTKIDRPKSPCSNSQQD